MLTFHCDVVNFSSMGHNGRKYRRSPRNIVFQQQKGENAALSFGFVTNKTIQSNLNNILVFWWQSGNNGNSRHTKSTKAQWNDHSLKIKSDAMKPPIKVSKSVLCHSLVFVISDSVCLCIEIISCAIIINMAK